MGLKGRLQQKDGGVNSGAETPSKTRPDFFRRRKARRTPARESARGRDCKELRCRRFPSPVCSLADPPQQPSANKEQRLRIYESKKSRDVAASEYPSSNQSCSMR